MASCIYISLKHMIKTIECWYLLGAYHEIINDYWYAIK